MFGTSYRGSDEMNEPTWLENATSEIKFCLWPRRCNITGKQLLFKLAYRSRRFFRVEDNQFMREDRWYSKHEFIIMRLKYNI